MSAQDAPDWQRVVETVTETGEVTDASDWQRVVVGPGGSPVGGGGGTSTGNWAPGDLGLSGWTFWPLLGDSGENLDSQGLFLTPFKATASVEVSYLWLMFRATATVSASATGQVGLYSFGFSGGIIADAVQLAVSGQTAAVDFFQDSAVCPVPITSYTLTAGKVYWAASAFYNDEDGVYPSVLSVNTLMVPLGGGPYLALPAGASYWSGWTPGDAMPGTISGVDIAASPYAVWVGAS